MTEKRSPIKEAPLPLAGESLRERRKRLWEDRLEGPLVTAAAAIGIAALEWWRYFFPSEPKPWTMSAMALGAIAFLLWRAKDALPKLSRLRLGEEGERKVGEELEKLRSRGYQVFHDVPGPGFNVDHVLVGPAGLVCIETKTWSKPASGEAKIAFDGETLTVLPTGWHPSRDPVTQARALADWLGGLIKQSAGKDLFVRPVVLFPGWWIDQSKGSTREVWVLEPKALGGFLGKDTQRLAPEDIKLASFHLSQYVRSVRAREDN